MRLVKLEIKGFKSFAKETVLHFGEDVIGVVGPNGSGKSNIVDAIRWVLGEQKKGELRLDKMSSVIFNGTKKRKPSNTAQVFLTFDNNRGVLRSEFEQVTIGRLLYRNGDSEYRLNGVPCRRKDITDLFVDTGIESNSYAIIALGMVDDILADKDNSRLRMLEQAAGISVYKVRKRETLNRLRRTQEDLDRVEDLLHELDGNLKDLAKQAKRTKRFFELKQRYQELSLDFAYLSSRDLRAQATVVSEQLSEASTQLTTKAEQQSQTEQRVEQTQRDLLTEEQHLTERRRQLGSVAAKLRSAINERQLAEQKVDYLTQNADKLSEQRAKLLAEQARLQQKVIQFESQVVKTRKDLVDFDRELKQAEEELSEVRSQTEALRDAVRGQAVELQQRESAVLAADREQALIESRLEAAKFEASNKARRRVADNERLTQLQEEATLAKAREQKLLAQMHEAETQESARAVNEQQLRDELDGLRPQLLEQRSELQRVQNEATLLQALIEGMEGSSPAVKYLANQAGWRDKYPQLADVFTVASGYEAAIEAVLGPILTSFVVPDAVTAAEGLRVLAEAGQPRTSILLNRERSERQPAKLASPNGTQAAISLIHCDDQYQSLLSGLLRGVGVTSDAAATIALAEGQSVVDTDGRQVWSAAQAIGGRKPKLQGQQTGRRKRLASLDKSIDKLSDVIRQLEDRKAELEHALQELRSSQAADRLKSLRQRHAELDRLADRHRDPAAATPGMR